MLRRLRISLASKCQLLFGAAVVLILIAALAIVWPRMQALVDRGPKKRAEDIADAWLSDQVQLVGALSTPNAAGVTDDDDDQPMEQPAARGLKLTLVEESQFDRLSMTDPFLRDALDRFEHRSDARDYFQPAGGDAEGPLYRYARAIRARDIEELAEPDAEPITTAALPNPLRMVLLVELREPEAARQRLLNGIYIGAAGGFAGLLALAVFWYITNRLVLRPVGLLSDYAERVSEGDLNLRADVNTGDEFEDLAQMFNVMLESIKANADKLQTINKTLDLKINELAQTNVALYEADKMKGEFLANVSHELRTPLNSIIGFAEVLQETLAEAQANPLDEKRRRYAQNIITSSKLLLDLITDLLDLAKIEAGRMEVSVAPVSLADTCEGLINFIRPQAEKKAIALDVTVDPNVPVVHTDPMKLQQVIFNFLSNAVKFTPTGGSVTLTAGVGIEEGTVVIAVTDTGPGIGPQDVGRIFDKFVQLDPTATKAHGGTGLGLTICKELSQLLQGEIDVDTTPGRGSTFSLILPIHMKERVEPLMPA